MERAYLALEKKEDRNKLEEYLKMKLHPLLASGAAKTVDWDKVLVYLLDKLLNFCKVLPI